MNRAKRPRRRWSEAHSEPTPARQPPPARRGRPTALRVIAGSMRGRPVWYSGDRATRPMKDSVRENLFNIVGRALDGIIAWDLFAGTGVLGIEAISRGAASAIAFESSRAAAQGIRRSAAALGIEDRVQCVVGDTFRLAPRRLAAAEGTRRIVFLCPPYDFWESREDDLQTLIQASIAGAAAGSLIVVESDKRWDNRRLPGGPWDLRVYGGTQLAVLEIEAPSESPS